jgi:iron complex outermembrane receptor protein
MGGLVKSDGGVGASASGAAIRAPFWLAAFALLMAPGLAAAQQAPGATENANATVLPEIHVIATSPIAPPSRPKPAPAAAAAATIPAATEAAAQPGVVDADKIPSNVQTISASDLSSTTTPGILDAMERALPGVALSDQTGNEFQRDLNYRGFIASPVIGTPQGLAVYQNGIRINEVFGDTVNWDLIPQNAINGMTLVPSNPVYGLNAIGGALSMQMKNGFSYHGVEGELNGGSYGRISSSVQAGGEVGNLSGYIAADAIDDAGWRDDSASSLRRVYADLGARGDQTEFHVTFTGADNKFGAAAATPVEMLAQNWSSIYTIPQTTQNQLAFLTASASWKPSDTWTYQANAYYRNFQQSHVDGNGTDAQTCPPSTVLCFPNLDGTFSNLTTTSGQTVPATGTLGTSILG